jgi:prophage regulatory protein
MPSTVTPSHPVASSPGQALAYGRRRAHFATTSSDTPETVPSASVAPCERLLRLRDVLTIVGLSRAHVYNLVKQGLFPRPIALGSNCARWIQSEVQAWVSDSIVAARLTPAERRSRRTNSR